MREDNLQLYQEKVPLRSEVWGESEECYVVLSLRLRVCGWDGHLVV